MADPEIQNILNDPSIRQVLTDFQENPAHAQRALAGDASIRAKVEKLIAAGVLQVK
jgi:stress-induced-phosphoprotein 1